MTLPTYEDLAEWMSGRGIEPIPPPDLEPTRVGLARYAMKCAYEDLYAPGDQRYKDGKYEDLPEWDRIYRSCTWAYDALLQEFHLRTSRGIWSFERAKVDWMLTNEPRPQGDDPQACQDRVWRDKVLRWARS